MMGLIGQVMRLMLEYYAGDTKRINHFMKVYGFAKAIGKAERLGEKTQLVLKTAALTHDIGIINSEHKYNSASGNHQQVEGPSGQETAGATAYRAGADLSRLLADCVSSYSYRYQ